MDKGYITGAKDKSRKCREYYELWKEYSTIIKKYRMENTSDRKGKNKSNTTAHTNEQENRVKRTNLCRSEISLWDNKDPIKKHEEKVKTRMGYSTGNVNKKHKKIGQNDKYKKDAEILGNRKERATRKKKIQLEENNQKALAKEGGLKRPITCLPMK